GGPETAWPRYSTEPPLGLERPAIRRSSVDLPEPERPSSPTSSPSFSERSTLSSTTSGSPLGRRKLLLAPRTARICSPGMAALPYSVDAVLALGECIERAPEQSVQANHIDDHHHDPEQHPVHGAGLGRLGDIGADAVGNEVLIAPAHPFRDDRRVPGAA